MEIGNIDHQNSELAAIELTTEDLDDISGGLDIFISGSMFDQSNDLFAQSDGSGCGGGGSTLANSSKTSSGTFQFMGLGFESASEIFAVFAGLSRLFGR